MATHEVSVFFILNGEVRVITVPQSVVEQLRELPLNENPLRGEDAFARFRAGVFQGSLLRVRTAFDFRRAMLMADSDSRTVEWLTGVIEGIEYPI
jgi:hypothetical protein